MIDTTLIDTIKKIVDKEKEIKEFKNRIRIKGKVVRKSLTKKQNLKITVKKNDTEISFIILKSHKDKYAMAERLSIGRSVSVVGIRKKLRMIICTQFKLLDKGVDNLKQMKIDAF